jgi:lysyl-tRNA synthetase class 2
VKTPDRLRDALRRRADLYTLIRRFFAERNVLEVETPILSAGANTDPNIQSFSTRFRGKDERWLRTSSEFAQKRLLAAGVGDCYELGRVFRDGEAGRRHNPEFTMLEWYRVGRDHRWLISETVELICVALDSVDRPFKVFQTTYRDLFKTAIDVDPFTDAVETLRAALGENSIDPAGLTRDDWLDLLLTHRIQPNFAHDRITVVVDYPPTQCALAQIRDGVAERFEVYVGVHELANGYHELTDAAEQRGRFERDNMRRRERNMAELPIDTNFLGALECGMPACSGVALGIERLLMTMADTETIADVFCFPFDEA